MIFRSEGSTLYASARRASASRFTHKICKGISGSSIPKNGAFVEFAAINLDALKPFSTQSSNWVRAHLSRSATGRVFYNFRMLTHFCFAIALVDEVEETTAVEIRTTNPFGLRVDLLWYEIPMVYELIPI